MKFAYTLLVSIFALLLVGCAAPSSHPSAESLNSLADTAFEYARYDSAKNKYQQVLEIYPEEAHARLMLARIDLLEDRPHAAQAQLQQLLLEKSDNAAEAAFILGRHYLNQGELFQASNYLQQGLGFDEQHAGLHNLLAITKDEQQFTEQAEKHFLRAIELEPDSKSFRVNLSFHYLLQGEFKLAQSQLQPLMKGNRVPDFVTQHYALVLLAQDEEQQAFELLTHSMSSQQAEQDIALLKQQLSRLQ
ncbi:tetratricopeptide repeat protein [Vibrio vulnificus]|uniref:tetratricopeptide repeat protein n=1 Tax=Vibrio vulnificus TaxID=672 RepID=UPI00325144FE